jgi:hypothetical protein
MKNAQVVDATPQQREEHAKPHNKDAGRTLDTGEQGLGLDWSQPAFSVNRFTTPRISLI